MPQTPIPFISNVSWSILVFVSVQFVTWREGECVVDELGMGDAVLFHSEKCHNISTVLSGTRQSLVVELWDAPRENLVDRFE